MAAVLMHKLPGHSLLHDLLHLQDRGSQGKDGISGMDQSEETCSGVGAQEPPLLPGFPRGTGDLTKGWCSSAC